MPIDSAFPYRLAMTRRTTALAQAGAFMDISTGFSDFFYSASDGLKLHARVYGDDRGAGLPVICLPGLTRNARDFHDLALRLSRDTEQPRKVVAFDYRGRGQSA